MIKNIIIVILIILLLITIYSYYCLSNSMASYETERLQYIINKENELAVKQDQVNKYNNCNSELDQYKKSIEKIKSAIGGSASIIGTIGTNGNIGSDKPVQSTQSTQSTQSNTNILSEENPVVKTAQKNIYQNNDLIAAVSYTPNDSNESVPIYDDAIRNSLMGYFSDKNN